MAFNVDFLLRTFQLSLAAPIPSNTNTMPPAAALREQRVYREVRVGDEGALPPRVVRAPRILDDTVVGEVLQMGRRDRSGGVQWTPQGGVVTDNSGKPLARQLPRHKAVADQPRIVKPVHIAGVDRGIPVSRPAEYSRGHGKVESAGNRVVKTEQVLTSLQPGTLQGDLEAQLERSLDYRPRLLDGQLGFSFGPGRFKLNFGILPEGTRVFWARKLGDRLERLDFTNCSTDFMEWKQVILQIEYAGKVETVHLQFQQGRYRNQGNWRVIKTPEREVFVSRPDGINQAPGEVVYYQQRLGDSVFIEARLDRGKLNARNIGWGSVVWEGPHSDVFVFNAFEQLIGVWVLPEGKSQYQYFSVEDLRERMGDLPEVLQPYITRKTNRLSLLRAKPYQRGQTSGSRATAREPSSVAKSFYKAGGTIERNGIKIHIVEAGTFWAVRISGLSGEFYFDDGVVVDPEYSKHRIGAVIEYQLTSGQTIQITARRTLEEFLAPENIQIVDRARPVSNLYSLGQRVKVKGIDFEVYTESEGYWSIGFPDGRIASYNSKNNYYESRGMHSLDTPLRIVNSRGETVEFAIQARLADFFAEGNSRVVTAVAANVAIASDTHAHEQSDGQTDASDEEVPKRATHHGIQMRVDVTAFDWMIHFGVGDATYSLTFTGDNEGRFMRNNVPGSVQTYRSGDKVIILNARGEQIEMTIPEKDWQDILSGENVRLIP